MPTPSRRRFLQCATVTTGLLAGCTSFGSSGGGDQTTTSETGATATPVQTVDQTTPTDGCPEGYTELTPFWRAAGPGPRHGFELSLQKTEIDMGDMLVARVRNATSAEQTTGHKAKFDIQYNSGGNWETIYGMDGEMQAWVAEVVRHPPGTGFTYRLPFTRSGLSNPTDHYPPLGVCSQLKPGTYRFIYWGLHEDESTEDQTEAGIAQSFTVRPNNS